MNDSDHGKTIGKGGRVRYLVMHSDGEGFGEAHIARTPAYGTVTSVRPDGGQHGGTARIRAEHPGDGHARYVTRYLDDIEPAGPPGITPGYGLAWNTRQRLHLLTTTVYEPNGDIILGVAPGAHPDQKVILAIPDDEWAKLTAIAPGQPGRHATGFGLGKGGLWGVYAIIWRDGNTGMTVTPDAHPDRKQVLTLPAHQWARLTAGTRSRR